MPPQEHTTSSAHMASLLEDTQESLAAALARVEALRTREKTLLAENQQLKRRLKASPGDGAAEGAPQDLDLTQDGDHLQPGAETQGPLEAPVQHYPVLLYTNRGKALAAMVEQTEDSLVFYEQRARINAVDFVGMGGVHMPEKISSGKSGLFSYFIGKTKGLKGKGRDNDIMQSTATTGLSGDSSTHDIFFQTEPETHTGHSRTSFETYLEKLQVNGNSSIDENQPGDPIEGLGIEHNGSHIRQMLWKDRCGNGRLKKMIFEAAGATVDAICQHIESWSGHESVPQEESSNSHAFLEVHSLENSQKDSEGSNVEMPIGVEGELVPPKHFIPDGPMPSLNARSVLLSDDRLKCLTAALPKRHRQCPWKLLYSTENNGFSLQTLYRKSSGVSPTILVLRDMSDYILGAYCSEPWKISPRFFGTGETFVFQLEPHRIYYPWKKKSNISNAFFMYASPDSIGIGGTGKFALWLDGELLNGNSGLCDTFGSPCLSKDYDFKIKALELWGLQ